MTSKPVDASLYGLLVARIKEPNGTQESNDFTLAELQRDIWYFLLLTVHGYDFSTYNEEDLGELFRWISSLDDFTTLYPEVVKIIEEAEEAIKELWQKPPVNTILCLTWAQVSKILQWLSRKES